MILNEEIHPLGFDDYLFYDKASGRQYKYNPISKTFVDVTPPSGGSMGGGEGRPQDDIKDLGKREIWDKNIPNNNDDEPDTTIIDLNDPYNKNNNGSGDGSNNPNNDDSDGDKEKQSDEKQQGDSKKGKEEKKEAPVQGQRPKDSDLQKKEQEEREKGDVSKNKGVWDPEKAKAKLTKLKGSKQDVAKKLDDESSNKREEEAKKKADKAARERYKGVSKLENISKLKRDIDKMIKTQVGDSREETWSRPNRRYGDTDILKKGVGYREYRGKKPVVNVYFDQSGSWTDEDIKKGMQAIATLLDFEKKNLIKTYIYYFDDGEPQSTPSGLRGGTSCQGVFKHIQATKPMNVVIMTDSDTSHENLPYITVPGAAWRIWKNGSISDAVANNLRGRKQTADYGI